MTHFPQVPVEIARALTAVPDSEFPPPLVYVVDDEPLIAETLAAILNGSGFAAFAVCDAFEALELTALIPAEMLITDIVMPGLNGIDLALSVIAAIPDCDVILFSAQSAAFERVLELRATGRDIVTLCKPVHPTDLLANVRTILTSRRAGHKPRCE